MRLLKILCLCLLIATSVSCNNSSEAPTQNKMNISPDQIKSIGTAAYDEIKTKNNGKVILINFFASWCDACKQETPGFINAYRDLKGKGFEIVGLSVDRTVAEAADFINKFGVNYPVYYADESLRRKFNITYLPTNIIYGPDGALLDVHVGFISEDDLHGLVDKLQK